MEAFGAAPAPLERAPVDVQPESSHERVSENTRTFEAIIRWYRPALVVKNDRFLRMEDTPETDRRFIDPNDGASQALLANLENNRSKLDPALRSVGRIELKGNPQYPWIGTGWIVDSELGKDIVVTNAHVAREFAQRSAAGFVFRAGFPDPAVLQSARIDFREEIGGSASREFAVRNVIWISENPRFDMALLRVVQLSGNDQLSPPIKLLTEAISDEQMLAVAGYPGSGGGYDPEPFQKLFGLSLGKKRFSPGFYMGERDQNITYDCSTLPGSSGSVVLDVSSGKALGLHFAGTAFDTNYAMSARDIAGVIKNRPWQGEMNRSTTKVSTAAALKTGFNPNEQSVNPVVIHHDAGVSIVLPLEITVRLGSSAPINAASVATRPSANDSKTDRVSAETVAKKVAELLRPKDSVYSVTADYLFRNGEISDDFGVIVKVAPDADLSAAGYGLSDRFNGVEIAIEAADPETVLGQFGIQREAFAERQAEYKRDLSDKRFNLDPVMDDMTLTLHVSPEVGWLLLEEFLNLESFDQLTIGMYHMTAPHVVNAVQKIAKAKKVDIKLVLDRQRGDAEPPDDTGSGTKANDIPERDTLEKLKRSAGKRFTWAPAALGAQALFPTAYHIKVAVWSKRTSQTTLDDQIVWLSSGNWQSSNQAPITKSISALSWEDVENYNREWHVIIKHSGLAATFRNHLEQDLKDNAAYSEVESIEPIMPYVLVPISNRERVAAPRQFRAFPEKKIEGRLRVQPLLTPDNYPEVVLELIQQARNRVLIENQSFNLWKGITDTPEHFLKLVRAVKEKQKAGKDVRIIFREGYGKEKETLRAMKKLGLRTDADHVRFFDKCHTKGIIIDDNIVVLGSQNWTAAGTGPNRDASIVIWNEEANTYFTELFEYDWSQVAHSRVRFDEEIVGPVRIVSATFREAPPSGYRRISLGEYLGET